MPGMLALGAEGSYEQSHMKLAEDLLQTCYTLYEQQGTGIGPERVSFFTQTNKLSRDKDFLVLSTRYLLRPETIESLFVLYRKTHNELYRDWAWRIFKVCSLHGDRLMAH